MRVSATFGLVVLLAALASCEQRNYARCLTVGTDYQCEAGKFCKAIPGDTNNVGTCVASECTVTTPGTPNGCLTATLPVCTSQGSCIACTTKDQCAAVDSTKPYCVTSGAAQGSCAECNTGADCVAANPLTTKPACDLDTHTCRACQRHDECTGSAPVCVKDNTLSLLADPLTLGMCAPASRVIVVNEQTCPASSGTCTLANQLPLASAQKPYVLVQSTSVPYSASRIVIAPIPGLIEQHLISSGADLSPSQVSMQSAVKSSIINKGFSMMTPHVVISPGVNVTIEGFIIRDAGTAVYCNSDNTASNGTAKTPVATSVKILRSLITSSNLAVQTRPLCQLTLDQSWIGTPPNVAANGNDAAMNLDSTQFEIVNSVFDHNFNGTTFGGITLSDSLAGNLKGRIVNSTFYRQENLTPPAMAISCANTPTSLIIFNTLFVNSLPSAISTWTNPPGRPYVDPRCRMAGTMFGYVATDESPAPTGTGVVTGVTDSIFTSAANSVLTILPDVAQAKPLLTGGVKDFNGSKSPLVDMDGKKRVGATTVTIGAFESP